MRISDSQVIFVFDTDDSDVAVGAELFRRQYVQKYSIAHVIFAPSAESDVSRENNFWQ